MMQKGERFYWEGKDTDTVKFGKQKQIFISPKQLEIGISGCTRTCICVYIHIHFLSGLLY